ncbi:MAG: hypothetical protein PHR07_09290 [Acidaminococcaceae bacterium]|nr:hypothetical protein [Acidaminococcaceae bacterium]
MPDNNDNNAVIMFEITEKAAIEFMHIAEQIMAEYRANKLTATEMLDQMGDEVVNAYDRSLSYNE